MHAHKPRPQQTPEQNYTQLSAATLLRRSTIQYGAMLLLALAVIHFGHENLPAVLHLPSDPLELARFVAIGVLGAGVLHVLSYFFEDWFGSFRQLRITITQLLGPNSAAVLLYLALLSAIAEELLFRGAIQPFAGLFVTAALFGLLHMGAGGPLSAWSLWAFIAGLLLGYMREETGNLWPPIFAHFGVNAISLLAMRRTWNQWNSQSEGQNRINQDHS